MKCLLSNDLHDGLVKLAFRKSKGLCQSFNLFHLQGELEIQYNREQKRGEFIGSFAPYGLRKDPENRNKLLIDKETAQVIVQIFVMHQSGKYSKNAIAQQLNDSGILSPIEYKRQKGSNYKNPIKKHLAGNWTARTITDILKNQMYIGHMVQKHFK